MKILVLHASRVRWSVPSVAWTVYARELKFTTRWWTPKWRVRYELGHDAPFSVCLNVPHDFRIFVLRGWTYVTFILMTTATATVGCFSIASFSPLLSVLIAPAPKWDVHHKARSRQKTLTRSRPTNFQMKVSKAIETVTSEHWH